MCEEKIETIPLPKKQKTTTELPRILELLQKIRGKDRAHNRTTNRITKEGQTMGVGKAPQGCIQQNKMTIYQGSIIHIPGLQRSILYQH